VRVDQVAAPPTPLRSGILPVVTGALVAVGRELPRILPAVLDLLDRRPPQTSSGNRTPSKQVTSRGRGGRRHRHRRRGG
jgi:hypothetical protein